MSWPYGFGKRIRSGMASSSARPVHWHSFVLPESEAEAVVALMCASDELSEARDFATRWRHVVPRCAFAGFEADNKSRKIAFAPIQDLVGRALRDLGLTLSQLVLIGRGRSGQQALDLALCNALPDANAIVVDLPSQGVVVGLPPARGAFRLIQHRNLGDPDGHKFDQTIHVLREACLDIRTMGMPDDSGATDRAIGTFLVELVARASRYQARSRGHRGLSSAQGKLA